MGRHAAPGSTIEREVVAENERERTALAHLRGQRHYGPACPVCQHRESEARLVSGAYDRGYSHGWEAALSMVAEEQSCTGPRH